MQNNENFIQLHSPELRKALKNREDYFASLEGEKLERALALQEFIDDKLKKAGNQNNRLTIINKMMIDSLRELHKLIDELSVYQ